MITTIRYPLLFRARPPRCGEMKDVFCTFAHTVDVPEVSSAEVRSVMHLSAVWPQPVVEYEGRIFRSIGAPEAESTVRAMSLVFMKQTERNDPWRFTFEGGNRSNMPPLSQALRNTLCNRLYLMGDGGEREEAAWPFLNDTRRYSSDARDAYRFEDFERKLDDVDMAGLEAMRMEHAREASKLLVIDGQYWIETPPPAICVDIAGYDTSARAVCEVVFLPDWPDTRLGREYFPLHAKDEAIEYARIANELTPGADPFEDYCYEADLSRADDPVIDFDHIRHSLCRTTSVLAGDAARQISKSAEIKEKLGEDRIRSVIAARDLAIEMGTVIGDWPDLSCHTFDVVEAWKGSGRKPGRADIPQTRRSFGDLICDRAKDAAADMPISLALDTPGGFRP